MRKTSGGLRLAMGCLALLMLHGCRQDPPPRLDDAALPSSSSTRVETPSLEVTAVATCDGRQPVTLRWNHALVADGPVDLRVDTPGRPLFATVAVAGSKDTGEWARRGMAFVALTSRGDLLARAVVEGPDACD